jgi:hypothetical protein
MNDFLGGDDWLDDWADRSRREAIIKPVLDEKRIAEIKEINERQAKFVVVVDTLIALYRAFDTTPRKKLKLMMKDVYERLKVLGEQCGVSRVSLDSIWKG